MAKATLGEADETYHVSGWSEGYFRINAAGRLAVRPSGAAGPEADLYEIVQALRREGSTGPLLLRFLPILEDRVRRINDAFAHALAENACGGARYRGVFPIKVNQRKEVVQALAKAGRKYAHGLEVGSKAELIAALTMDPNRRSLLVVNGFKDAAFLEAACAATAFKDDVVIVLDEVGELEHLLPILKEAKRQPWIGLRVKLRSRAPGKWALSGGERSKFGLTVPEILHVVERLREAGALDRLAMLHFHIGSQIGDIRRIMRGVREAARLHVELARLGAPLRFLDIGGGLAVDYDGSGSSGPNSANYTIEEYASSVVATVKDVCEEAGTPVPDLISESGRAVTAHHALLVIEVLRRIPGLPAPTAPQTPRDDDPTPLWNLLETWQGLNAKNVFESFHDALQVREDLQDLFDLGHLDVARLGRAENAFRGLMTDVRRLLIAEDEEESEEFAQVSSILAQKLVCNFSLFQSMPDVWGVKQQFPMVPLHRLREAPDETATLADITCDSDGEVRRFVDPGGTRGAFPVHGLQAGRPYFLAVALVGAYQDSLGDYHNLFGETEEALVDVAEDGTWTTRTTARGSRVGDMLEWVRYEPADLKRRLRGRVQRLSDAGRIDAAEAKALTSRLNALIDGSTYLETPIGDDEPAHTR